MSDPKQPPKVPYTGKYAEQRPYIGEPLSYKPPKKASTVTSTIRDWFRAWWAK